MLYLSSRTLLKTSSDALTSEMIQNIQCEMDSEDITIKMLSETTLYMLVYK